MKTTVLLLALTSAAAAQQAGAPATALPELAPPVRIAAGGAPITIATGHAAPFVVDLDGDGKKDLVVGQFGEGKARVYLNKGTDTAPVFGDFTFLQAGGADARVLPG